eukprot:181392-Alexandrium_andersonii.AAC.1
MSASLVGSEMCIRDSGKAAWQHRRRVMTTDTCQREAYKTTKPAKGSSNASMSSKSCSANLRSSSSKSRENSAAKQA